LQSGCAEPSVPAGGDPAAADAGGSADGDDAAARGPHRHAYTGTRQTYSHGVPHRHAHTGTTQTCLHRYHTDMLTQVPHRHAYTGTTQTCLHRYHTDMCTQVPHRHSKRITPTDMLTRVPHKQAITQVLDRYAHTGTTQTYSRR
jgi:hypothetical protein